MMEDKTSGQPAPKASKQPPQQFKIAKWFKKADQQTEGDLETVPSPVKRGPGRPRLKSRSSAIRKHYATTRHVRTFAVWQANHEAEQAGQEVGLGKQPKVVGPMDVLIEKSQKAGMDPVVLQMKTIFHLLQHGRPMEMYPQMKPLFDLLGVPKMRESRWNGKAGWQMAECLDAVLQEDLEEAVQAARCVLCMLMPMFFVHAKEHNA